MLLKFFTKKKIIIELPISIYQSFGFSKIKTNSYSLKNERCGIVVGTRIDYEKINITHLIEDKTPLLQNPFQVLRVTSHIYPELIRLIENNGNIDYLGEWHTHPNGPICASWIDHSTMKEMVNNLEFGDLKWVILMIFLPDQKIVSYYYENNNYSKIECNLI